MIMENLSVTVEASPSKILKILPKEQVFYFYSSIGNYTGKSASSLEEFLERAKHVDVKSLEFHLYRGDFEKWISQTLEDSRLTQEFRNLRTQKVTGTHLRDYLCYIVSKRLRDLKSRSTVQ
jgi:hypothetical protein